MSNFTPQKRLNQFNNKDLSIKKQKLYCNASNQELDHSRKCVIESHLKTPKHLANSKNGETSRTLDFSDSEKKDKFKRDLIIGFSSANIPLHKLQMKFFRSFFSRYIQPEFQIPSVTSLRKLLPKVYDDEIQKVKNYFADSKVAIICDETSDIKNRSVFQIILIKLNLEADHKPKLVNTIFLDDVNYETISREILDTLVKMDIKFKDVMAYITDNASYMLKAFKTVIKTLLFNCIHVTCFAHIINLVGETWRSNLTEMDSIVANLKSIFARGSNRKRRFIEFLKGKGINDPILYPSPVVTRWNTWFKAVKFIGQNFDLIKSFAEQECLIEETIALDKLDKLFKTENIKLQFEFVASKCDKFKFTLLKFEEQDFNSTDVYDIVFDLYFWLGGQLDSCSNGIGFQEKYAEKLFKDAHLKLKKYLIDGAQPAIEFFKNARVFDPFQVVYMFEDLDQFNFSDGIKLKLSDEWKIYLEICSELVKQQKPINFDLKQWWKGIKSRLPNFYDEVKWYLIVPSNSCDSERALSKYKIILDEKRLNMNEDTIRINNFFYFNFPDHQIEDKEQEIDDDDIIPLAVDCDSD